MRIKVACGQRLRAKMKQENCAMRTKLRAAVVDQPLARCITGYCCSVCKPDYILAMTMGLHPRLGEASPVSTLTDDLLRMIIEKTKPKRQVPAWMSCSWNLRMQQRRRARAVLDASRAAQRKREQAMQTQLRDETTQDTSVPKRCTAVSTSHGCRF